MNVELEGCCLAVIGIYCFRADCFLTCLEAVGLLRASLAWDPSKESSSVHYDTIGSIELKGVQYVSISLETVLCIYYGIEVTFLSLLVCIF